MQVSGLCDWIGCGTVSREKGQDIENTRLCGEYREFSLGCGEFEATSTCPRGGGEIGSECCHSGSEVQEDNFQTTCI